jgi:outer membrane protein with beta-barrel domain
MVKVNSSIRGLAVGASAALGALGSAPAAQAQLRLELTPFVGSYYALAQLGLTDPAKEEKHLNQPALGGALVVRLTPIISVEGAFAFAPSGTNVTSATEVNQGFSGTLIFASARGRFALPRTNVYGLAGVGIVRRGGEAWQASQFTKLTNIAGIVGFGARAEISPRVRLDVKAELQFYSFDPDGSAGTTYESKMQQDVIVTVGIPISLKRR